MKSIRGNFFCLIFLGSIVTPNLSYANLTCENLFKAIDFPGRFRSLTNEERRADGISIDKNRVLMEVKDLQFRSQVEIFDSTTGRSVKIDIPVLWRDRSLIQQVDWIAKSDSYVILRGADGRLHLLDTKTNSLRTMPFGITRQSRVKYLPQLNVFVVTKNKLDRGGIFTKPYHKMEVEIFDFNGRRLKRVPIFDDNISYDFDSSRNLEVGLIPVKSKSGPRLMFYFLYGFKDYVTVKFADLVDVVSQNKFEWTEEQQVKDLEFFSNDRKIELAEIQVEGFRSRILSDEFDFVLDIGSH